MSACIEGLRQLKESCDIEIFSDSNMIVQTYNKGWKRNKNIDLWRLLDEEVLKHKCKWVWVKAHNGNHYNEVVNALAQTEASKVSVARASKLLEYGSKQ
jgi:ribonuclease HI